ncbi:hypothetical protein DFJ58DRAFT_749929 [Suillus subalutaceus]|uniref:uncharacterized protein n=1 Tax=Suillus subalutaceus TaxID=48586 RepID=UPI001B8786BB|nr:uncharacterized protein DFJ58DRAFT_749929 [Suillus subalutaceus]KAG1836075.1 hypothetical protein DFJ58DRAFT_749929 [Suillus subalutaceus]
MLKVAHLTTSFMIYNHILFFTMLYTTDNIINLYMQLPNFFAVGYSYRSPPILTCLKCGPLYRSVTVAVVFDRVCLSVHLDDISMTFSRAHFESAAYVCCSVFKRFKNYREPVQQGTPLPTAASCIMSRLKDDPRWFSYTDACCAENLSALSAPVLRGVARRIGTKRSDARNKERSVDAIVSHFASRRTELASMSDDILFKSLLTASVPPACTRSRGTLLAAEFQNLYGLNLATTLWISASVDDIPRRLEKLKRTDI